MISVSRLMNTSIYNYVYIVLFLFGMTIQGQNANYNSDLNTSAIQTDGMLDDPIWEEAKSLEIFTDSKDPLVVLIAKDSRYLYVAFANISSHSKFQLQSEVLIDVSSEATTWDANCFWFHSSYSSCSAKGSYYYWDNCTTNSVLWQANNFPLTPGKDSMEFKISWELLGLQTWPDRLRIGFKASGPIAPYFYWPPEADISKPTTWGTFVFKQ